MPQSLFPETKRFMVRELLSHDDIEKIKVNRFVSVPLAAYYIGVSENTVRVWARKGIFSFKKRGYHWYITAEQFLNSIL